MVASKVTTEARIWNDGVPEAGALKRLVRGGRCETRVGQLPGGVRSNNFNRICSRSNQTRLF